MKAWMGMAVACAIGLALVACETQEGKKSEAKMEKKEMAAAKMLDAGAVMKAFKSGGDCKWKTAAGEGEDFYYTTEKAGAGVADRNVGGKTMSGTWMVKGDKLCLNFGTENCTGLTEVGKNTYKAQHASGAEMEMKC